MRLRTRPARTDRFTNSNYSAGGKQTKTLQASFPKHVHSFTLALVEVESSTNLEEPIRPWSMKVVRQAMEQPEGAPVRCSYPKRCSVANAKAIFSISSIQLANMYSPSGDILNKLAATYSLCSTRPYRGAGPRGEAELQAGRELCTKYEERLVELEKVIGDYEPNIPQYLRRKHKKELSDEEMTAEVESVKASARVYKEIIWKIILENVNASTSSRPFQLASAPCLSPTEHCVSDTVYCNAEPALIRHTNKEPRFRTNGATLAPLYFEMASQMHLRPDVEDMTHQGVAFDGLSATILMLRGSKCDLMAKHKAHWAQSIYYMPEARPVFIRDMIDLLRHHEDYRKVFTHVIYTKVWDAENGEFCYGPEEL